MSQPFTQFVLPDSIVKTKTNLPGNSSILTLPPSKQKILIRTANVPEDDPVRDKLWNVIVAQLKRTAGKYDSFTASSNLPAFAQHKNLTTRHLDDDGSQEVYRLLTKLHQDNPEITSCPALFSVTALLLHYHMPDEAYEMLSKIAPDVDFFYTTRLANRTSAYVLVALTRKYKRAAFNRFFADASREDIRREVSDWQLWILNDLPFGHTVRVVDCFLYEGKKVFYRVALVLLAKFARSRPPGAFTSAAMRQFCARFPFTAVELLTKAFKIRAISKSEVDTLLVKLQNESGAAGDAIPMQEMDGFAQLDVSAAPSDVLTLADFQSIWGWLPPRFRLYTPQRLFSTNVDGTNLQTMYRKLDEAETDASVVVVKAARGGEVFGAFCATRWQHRMKGSKGFSYFGTGETFVFTIEPKQNVYYWVGQGKSDAPPASASLFQAADSHRVTVGGGSRGAALELDEMLSRGRSAHTETYENDPFVPNSEDGFDVSVVEVFGLTPA